MIDTRIRNASVGVDVGGTFTDFAVLSPDGENITLKVPSTPKHPADAVLTGLDHLVREHGLDVATVDFFAHGSTVATNTLLERKGARIGLLTNKGFRDVLEIGRQMRQQMYSIRLDPETPVFLAPRRYRRGIPGRIGPDGSEISALDETVVTEQVAQLIDEGIDTLAVSFLFSFLNPAHERRVREIVRMRWPELPISLSSDVDPAFREYERTLVTAFDAYIKPIVNDYLYQLETEIAKAGITATVRIMQSRGGLTSCEVARKRPVRLFLSGPAAGVIGGQHEGQQAGFDDLITVDIGGTSCDISMISKAKPLLRHEGKIDGYAVRVPMVDVNAIGSGGGSVAWLDSAGGLRVGPMSAGSDPGPACYAKGGDQPTVTDASVLLGLLDPKFFAGGDVQLDPALAESSINKHIATPMGLTVENAALSIHRVVNAQMSEGIRSVTIRQGYDPRCFTLLALGGAGPLHSAELAKELGIRQILTPRHPGVLSAWGLLAAPIEHEVSGAFARSLESVKMEEIQATLAELDCRAEVFMKSEAVDKAMVEVSYTADVCYIGQSYHLEIPFYPEDAAVLQKLYDEFLVAHDRIYGHAANVPAQIVNLRTIHKVSPSPITLCDVWDEEQSQPSNRTVLTESGLVKAYVYRRSRLNLKDKVEGPAIIEQEDTTIWLPSGWQANVLANGSLLAILQEGGR